MGLVVQASLAAGHQNMAQTIVTHRLAVQACQAGLLCRPGGGLQGSTKYRGHVLIMGFVVQASVASRLQHMALTMLKIGLSCRPGGAAGQHQIHRARLNHGVCGAGFLWCWAAKHGSNDAQNRLVVQAWGAAGQHQIQGARFDHGACGAGLLSCWAATHGSSDGTTGLAGLEGRPAVQAWGGAGQHQIQTALLD